MAVEPERVMKTMRELRKSLKTLPGDPRPKDVHTLRTATRRVEAIAAALPADGAKESRRLFKSLEPVRKAAGGVRDMDVLTAHARRLARHSKGASLTQLVDLLQAARQQNAVELRRALGQRRKAARKRLKRYSRQVKAALEPALDRSDLAAVNHSSNGHLRHDVQAVTVKWARELSQWPALTAGNVHEFRLKVKELRYILQLLAEANSEFVDALGVVQHRVGDWHDWYQLEEIARKVFAQEQDGKLVGRIAEIAQRKLDQALATANALRRQYLPTAMPPPLGY